jgi:hypothetical protein
MNDAAAADVIEAGMTLADGSGRRIGTIDAVFVDYLLVRTAALVPVDVYVPITETSVHSDDELRVTVPRDEAIERWHRPLKRAPHADR